VWWLLNRGCGDGLVSGIGHRVYSVVVGRIVVSLEYGMQSVLGSPLGMYRL
jgi:hypothetical protein